MAWQQLVKTALLGIENSQLPETVLQVLQAKGIRTEADPAMVLLEGAAVFWQLQKAGFLLQSYEGNFPEPAAFATQKYCTPAAGSCLAFMLHGFHKKAIPEFFYRLKLNQQILLPELLPALFKSSIRSKGLWNLARPHIGAHGEWLLQQNPEWQVLVKRATEQPPVFEYHDHLNDPEEGMYYCFPQKLEMLHQSYAEQSNRRDWQTAHFLDILSFRINMLKAL